MRPRVSSVLVLRPIVPRQLPEADCFQDPRWLQHPAELDNGEKWVLKTFAAEAV